MNLGRATQPLARIAAVAARHLRMRRHAARCDAARAQWLASLTATDRNDVQRYVHEIARDAEFIRFLRAAYRKHTRRRLRSTDFLLEPTTGSSMFFHQLSLYALVRCSRPQVVVETGGTPGKSSAFLLRALQRNGSGMLYTVDLPPTPVEGPVPATRVHRVRPAGVRPNWCVPEDLVTRQNFLSGRAEELLPPLLDRLGSIDIFIHDSDHSYEHMSWEFREAFPHIRPGGWLWSDDVDANHAWRDFCREVGIAGPEFGSQGALRVPDRSGDDA